MATSNPSGGSLATLLAAVASLPPDDKKPSSQSSSGDVGSTFPTSSVPVRLSKDVRASLLRNTKPTRVISKTQNSTFDVPAKPTDSQIQRLLRDRRYPMTIPNDEVAIPSATQNRSQSAPFLSARRTPDPISATIASLQSCETAIQLLRGTGKTRPALSNHPLLPRVVSDESTSSRKSTMVPSLAGAPNAIFRVQSGADPKETNWTSQFQDMFVRYRKPFAVAPAVPSVIETAPLPKPPSLPMRKNRLSEPSPPSPYIMEASLFHRNVIPMAVGKPHCSLSHSAKTKQNTKITKNNSIMKPSMHDRDIVLAAIGEKKIVKKEDEAALNKQISVLMDKIFDDVEKDECVLQKNQRRVDLKRARSDPPIDSSTNEKRPCHKASPSSIGSKEEQISKMSVEELKYQESLKNYGKRWVDLYNRLVAYKEGHNGSTDVPKYYEKDPQLGTWVRVQNRTYKKSELSPERKRLLDIIDFSLSLDQRVQRKDLYDRYDARWDEMFQKLLVYKQDNDGCMNVPKRYAVDTQLGTWVSNQRNFYRKGKITEDRKKRLTDVGFVWKVKA